ncbi:hypothetical protein phiOC_p003 [Ochrobactrum phage vB_OspM_OC]|nr:hypothetical protein phiOC_p003 [Ochrobactrum phage vB_OspM_OC]
MTSFSDDDFGFREETLNPKRTKQEKDNSKSIDELEELIMSLLENLKNLPDKNGVVTIKWPDRVDDIEQNIKKVKKLLKEIRK